MDYQQTDEGGSLFQLNLDLTNSYTLTNAASWGKVLGIVSIIMGVLFVLLGIMIQGMLSNFGSGDGGSYYDDEARGNTSLVASMGLFVYAVMGIIFIVGGIFAYNFGNRIKKALRINDPNTLQSGFAACRNFFAFWAILTILSLLIMVIMFAGIASRFL